MTDILPPNQIDQRSSLNYILDRTFLRPREAIIFLNDCIQRAEGASKITSTLLRQAEVTYSQQRVVSLADEWRRDYPNLELSLKLLDHRETPFSLRDITKDQADQAAKAVLDQDPLPRDVIAGLAEDYFLGDKIPLGEFLESLARILYSVGVLGVKSDPYLARQWSYIDRPTLPKGQPTPDAMIDIHRTFWAALGVLRKGKGAYSEEVEP